MTTTVLMEREMFGMPVRQNNQTEFFCANDLIAAGNKYRAINGLPMFNLNQWMGSKKIKEFTDELERQFGKVIETTRGSKGSTWVHPFIFIDLALAIDPKLKVEAYKWLYDSLISLRNNSGDSYKKMCGALYDNCTNKNTFHRGTKKTALLIQRACNVNDWQKANENQLQLRDRIHENIALLCGVIRDNNQAIRIGILKALENR
jgi:hypothetical protein